MSDRVLRGTLEALLFVVAAVLAWQIGKPAAAVPRERRAAANFQPMSEAAVHGLEHG